MIFFICIIIGIIVGVAVIWSDWGFSIGETFLGAICGGFIGTLVGLIILLIGMGWFETVPNSEKNIVHDEQIEVLALKDNFNIEGSGFLLSMYVEEDLKYVYVYNDSERGMAADKIDADYAYIKYIEDNEQPYIQKWHEESKNRFIEWLFKPGYTYYTIYLPQGSVIEGTYEVDLE